MTAIRFEVPGAPVGQNQGYRHVQRRGRAITKLTDEAASYKALLAGSARIAHRRAGAPAAIERDAIVAVRFVFPTMGSDLDGPLKFVLDAVTAGSARHPGARLVVNDTRVRTLIVEKADADRQRPRTVVGVADDDEPGCEACGCVCGSLLP